MKSTAHWRRAAERSQEVEAALADQAGALYHHLPQIASFADQHYLIEKRNQPETKTSVRPLDADERTREIARMMSGRS